MAQVLSTNQQHAQTAGRSEPITIATGVQQPSIARTAPPAPLSANGLRSGHLNLDTFSPVNQNGSFAFDRMLKSGDVYKRTRKTKVRLPAPLLPQLPTDAHAPAAMEALLPRPPS